MNVPMLIAGLSCLCLWVIWVVEPYNKEGLQRLVVIGKCILFFGLPLAGIILAIAAFSHERG